jgi:DnaK suppressor protein
LIIFYEYIFYWQLKSPFNALQNGDNMTQKERKSFKMILEDLKKKTLNLSASEDDVIPASEIRGDDADINSLNMENDFKAKMSNRNTLMIRDINLALTRIEDESFGLCLECDDEIGTKRLLARPTTTLCLNCKEQEEKKLTTHQR